MNTAALTAPLAHRGPQRTPGLVGAELVKLRRRRGLMLVAVGLTVAPIVVAYVVLVVLHAVNPAHHGPAGGAENFVNTVELLRNLGLVAATVVGVTLATGDLRAGVFRELVATGRSRVALFAARVPAGLALVVPLVAASVATSAVASLALAGTVPGPATGLLIHTGAWIVLSTVFALLLSLGVASVIGSAAPSIAILLGWQLIVAPQLLMLGSLGVIREGLPGAGTLVLAPDAFGPLAVGVSMSHAAVAGAIAVWTLLPLAAGAWRTAAREA